MDDKQGFTFAGFVFLYFQSETFERQQIIECTEMKPECFLKSSNLIAYVHFTKT